MFYDFPFLLYHYKLGDDNDSDDNDSDDDPEAPDDDDGLSDDNNNQMMADMMSSASDFCPVGPTPAIMFGLREVIMMIMTMMMMSLMIMMPQVLVLGPDTVTTEDTLGNDTRAKMVVGAVNIALHNTGTTLPCLVQVSHDQDIYFRNHPSHSHKGLFGSQKKFIMAFPILSENKDN